MANTNKIILVATDFLEQSRHALEYAVVFAKMTQSQILLLHSIEDVNPIFQVFISVEEKKKIEDACLQKLNEIADKYNEVDINCRLEYGKAYEKIISVSDEIFPRFIFMGRTEMPDIQRSFMGSNTTHVVRNSKFPVITLKGKNPIPLVEQIEKKILLPLDLTKENREQLTAAIEFGKIFDAEIQLISILDENSISKEIQLLKKLNKASTILTDAGVVCKCEIVKETEKAIHQTIVDFSVQNNSMMIIIMTQAEEGLVKFFIGSTAQEVVNLSEKPVMSLIPWDYYSEKTIFSSFIDPLGLFDEKDN